MQIVFSTFTFFVLTSRSVFWRIRGDGWILKTPWMKPLFSERNGYAPAVMQWRGWRIFRLRAEEMLTLLVRTERML
jgi:hypothetical protein